LLAYYNWQRNGVKHFEKSCSIVRKQ
jgi:hypothetical protein